MRDAIRVLNLTKRFRFAAVPKRATVKDLVIRTIRLERGLSVVDALNDVSFSIEPGSMLGVIGRNGSGKTTLMRILAGILRPDVGEVRVEGAITPLLALGAGFHPDLTGRENARIQLLSLGLSRTHVNAFMDDVISFSEIGEFADAPLHTYSSGMMMRLAFSVAVCIDPDVLLVDEVLSVGDEAFATKCLTFIAGFRERGKTVVLVTHDLEELAKWCDVAMWLDEGTVAAFGDPQAVITAYRAGRAG